MTASAHDDTGCHAEHEEIREKVEDLCKSLEFHIAEAHGNVSDVKQLKKNQDRTQELVGQILDELIGPRLGPLHGDNRDEESGIAYMTRHMWAETQNGGLPASLSTTERRRIVGTVTVVLVVFEAIARFI